MRSLYLLWKRRALHLQDRLVTLISRIPDKEFTFSVSPSMGHMVGNRGMYLYCRGRKCFLTPKGSEPRKNIQEARWL